MIGPGPYNPLGTKALELDAPGILIHATSDRGSIGYNASHGCIRMTEESEAELFAMVPEGTRVAIVSAEAARNRGAVTPARPRPRPPPQSSSDRRRLVTPAKPTGATVRWSRKAPRNCRLSRMTYLPTTVSGAAATVCAIV